MTFVQCGAKVLNVCGATERHSQFCISPLCAKIPVADELCRCNCNFIDACPSSDCSLISFSCRARHIYSRMTSSLRRNARFCCSRYGGRTQYISLIRNNYINYRVTSNLPEHVLHRGGLLCQLCFLLRDGSFTFTSSCLSLEDINYLISNVGRD